MNTLRVQIAQMLVMGFDGCVWDPFSDIARVIAETGLGGVLLFDKNWKTGQPGKNIENAAQVKQLTQALQSATIENLPLFIAIDYEGGAVDRLKTLDGETLTPAAQAALSESDFIHNAERMAKRLVALGFNLNFAPCVDLNVCPNEGIIGRLGRSYSDNAAMVTRRATLWIEAFNRHGVWGCLKHFPGHGSACGDTHASAVDVTDTFVPEELAPYQAMAMLKHTQWMVMTAHVVNRKLDSSGLPATLSPRMLQHCLRETLGYQGLIISDDLQMHAIAQHYTLEEAVTLSINAGNDLLIFGNQLGMHTPQQVIDCIEQQVIAGHIPKSRIEEAYARIVQAKKRV